MTDDLREKGVRKMSEVTETLGEALPREIKRNQDLLSAYDSLPNSAGAFGASMIRADLATAVDAMASGDVVAMLRAYHALKDNE